MNHARELPAGTPSTRLLRRRRRHGPQNGVLNLQQAAGNRAVGAILARQPGTKEAPKEQEQRTSHVLVPDIGRIELVSFQWGMHREYDRDEAPRFSELSLTTTAGKHSTALMQAAAKGTTFKEVEIVHYSSSGQGIRLKLSDVMLVSYHVGGGSEADKPVETWTVSFGTVKQEYIQPTE
jgi:type VI protein secretion system component Hcp